MAKFDEQFGFAHVGGCGGSPQLSPGSPANSLKSERIDYLVLRAE